MTIPNHIRGAILWQEIYEDAVSIGMDKYSATIYATDTLADIEENDNYDWFVAYSGEE